MLPALLTQHTKMLSNFLKVEVSLFSEAPIFRLQKTKQEEDHTLRV